MARQIVLPTVAAKFATLCVLSLLVLMGAVSCTSDDESAVDARRTAEASQSQTPIPEKSDSPTTKDDDHPTPANPALSPNADRPNPFVGFSGVFHAPVWDDRELSDEQKAADPVFNPAWVPFSQCLADRGLEVRPDPSQKFSQMDVDHLLERLNAEYPDVNANRQIPFHATGKMPGDAGTFLDCAEAWLLKTPQEVYDLTGVPNEYLPSEPSATVSPAP